MLLTAPSPDVDDARILSVVSRAFLDTIPDEFRTHCVFCSQVVSYCLEHLGVPNRVAPCQLLCSYRGRAVLLGFTGTAKEGKWDGHAVVRCNNFLFDGAIATFQRDHGFKLPSVIVAPCVTLPSNLKAKIAAGEARLSWLKPPAGADASIPVAETEAIAKYSQLLLVRSKQLLESEIY